MWGSIISKIKDFNVVYDIEQINKICSKVLDLVQILEKHQLAILRKQFLGLIVQYEALKNFLNPAWMNSGEKNSMVYYVQFFRKIHQHRRKKTNTTEVFFQALN